MATARIGNLGICCVSMVAAAALSAGPARAEDAALRGLQPVATPTRPLFAAKSPVLLRLSLVNTTDELITVPLRQPLELSSGLVLPDEIVFGSTDEPALTLIRDDADPVMITPSELEDLPKPRGGRRLRLAPHGTLGAEIDLQVLQAAVRYPGAYRVEWRPLGGRIGTAVARFRIEARKDAIVITDYGKLTFVLEYDRAPVNVDNFLELVRDNFYTGLTFHRIVPGFLIQGGCPQGNGYGRRPDGRLLPAEFYDVPFDVGTLAMARKLSDEDSASCQFFITLARLPDLDGEFTVIGQARDPESIRTLHRLAQVSTDTRDRPMSPVAIRSINLLDAESTRVRQLLLELDAEDEKHTTE